jgi:hypothetical protein
VVGNNFQADMIDTCGQSFSDDGDEYEPDYSVSIAGNPILINDIGEKFKEYIRAWKYDEIDEDSEIKIYKSSSVIRVISSSIKSNNISFESDKPPIGINYSSSGLTSTYIFYTPLTIVIQVDDTPKYITMYSKIHED